MSWIDNLKSGDKVFYDGDSAVVFSVIRQRPIAPDYFKLDFDDGSYIDVNDNELIANGKYQDYPNTDKAC
jgi:hypothetical protein